VNPIYDSLVVEFYLSKGLVPFTREPVKVWATRENPMPRGQVIGFASDVSKAKSYFNLKG
jgi:hypothetical protein